MSKFETTFEKRLERTMNAISMKPVDKIPFHYSGPACMARMEGMTMNEFVHDFDKATDACVHFLNEHPGIDAIHSPTMYPPVLANLWLSEIRTPGEELPDDELWQVVERDNMKPEDYERIIKIGYGPWREEYFKKYLGNIAEKTAPFIDSLPMTYGRIRKEAGVPIMKEGPDAASPIESIAGARGLVDFFMDIMDEPELVKKAMDVAFDHLYKTYTGSLDGMAAAGAKPSSCWIGGWRGAPAMMSQDIWMEYVWPYIRKFIDATLDRGILPILHFDSCWDSEIETLKELPPRSCLLMLDGSTDMRRARGILGDHLAMMGDVPSTILAYGTDNQVYDYVTKLIDDCGSKTGLIISSGCDCPMNAKPENVNAMIQAAADYI
ncbi:MAG: hypothetical protein HFI89_13465 [Lachnospiraceae bacterium]|nr:hypothetical protein [Lachnospiraceae bacterium]